MRPVRTGSIAADREGADLSAALYNVGRCHARRELLGLAGFETAASCSQIRT